MKKKESECIGTLNRGPLTKGVWLSMDSELYIVETQAM